MCFDAGELIQGYPPQWRHPNKQAVYELVCNCGIPFTGLVTYARWREIQLPDVISARVRFEVLSGFFDYVSRTPSGTGDWHLNFADPNLFTAYGSSLLAQDELQVAEHPVLGSLREALAAIGKPPRTVDEHGRPTPVTITGVQRRCVIDTMPDARAHRPQKRSFGVRLAILQLAFRG